MKGILVYQPPDKPALLPEFIDSLDPRLREKIIMQLYQLSKSHKPELREPHFKRFSLERYRDLCELRVKSKMLVRMKNTACLEWLIQISSAPDALVVDPFMGSGSTALAAVNTGRHFLGCEIVPEYHALALQRLGVGI